MSTAADLLARAVNALDRDSFEPQVRADRIIAVALTGLLASIVEERADEASHDSLVEQLDQRDRALERVIALADHIESSTTDSTSSTVERRRVVRLIRDAVHPPKVSRPVQEFDPCPVCTSPVDRIATSDGTGTLALPCRCPVRATLHDDRIELSPR